MSTGSVLKMASNGNIGIGTANPTEKLEVNGIIKAEGLKINNLSLNFEAASATNPEAVTWGTELMPTPQGPSAPLFEVSCIDPLNIERANERSLTRREK